MNAEPAAVSRSPVLKGKSLLACIGSVVAVRMLVKAMGYGEKMTLAYFFHLGVFLDSFTVAVSVPMMAYFCVRAVTAPTILPMFAARAQHGDRSGAWGQIHAWLLVIMATLAVFAAATYVYADTLAALLGPGFNASQRALCASMLRIMTPVSCAIGLLPLAEAVLNAERRFLFPPLSEFALKAGSIVMVVSLARTLGIEAAAWGIVAGVVCAIGVSLRGVGECRYERNVAPGFGDAEFKQTLLLMAAPGLAEVFSRLGTVVENAACSTLQPGSVAALDFARKLINTPLLIIPLATGTVLFTAFTELHARTDREGGARLLMASVRAMLFLFVPLVALTWVLAEPVVTIAYKRGAFDAASVELVSMILRLLSPTMCLLAIEGIIMSHFFSRKDLWAPAWSGIGTVILRVGLITALVGHWGLPALAFAIVFSRFVKILVLSGLLGLRGGVTWKQAEAGQVVRVLLVSAVCTGVASASYRWLAPQCGGSLIGQAAGVGCVGVLCGAVYLSGTYMLGVAECRYMAREAMKWLRVRFV